MEALMPFRCCACGHFYKPFQSHPPAHETPEEQSDFAAHLSGFLCPTCISSCHAVSTPQCVQCGSPFASTEGRDHLCGECAQHPFHFHAARAAGRYEGALRTVIQHFKYRGRVQMAPALGRMLWQTLLSYWHPDQFDWILPVPLHPRRLRQRGFNQAALLMRRWPALAASKGFDWRSDKIAAGLLMRGRNTAFQTGLNRRRRMANLRQAFAVEKRRAIKAGKILLVDDVLTTGATADACADALIRAGAASVHVLALARTVVA